MVRTERKLTEKHPTGTCRLTLTLTAELKQALTRKALEMFGDRKGSLSAYVEMVMRNELGLVHPSVEET